MFSFDGPALPLSQAGLSSACRRLGAKAAEIWAIVRTETDFPHCGFLPDRRPQILFERHVFSELTQGRFDRDHPEISNQCPGGYGATGAHQYERLAAAIALDEAAALQSASWGMGQELGRGFRSLGYASVEDMVSGMVRSEDAQLDTMVRFILANRLDDELRGHDWTNFARRYNGPDYAEHRYDRRLAGFHALYAAGNLPDLSVRALQVYLMYLGFPPSDIDGVMGPRTRSAMNQFQENAGLPVTSALDEATFAALARAAGQG